jgi:hypothetical protein
MVKMMIIKSLQERRASKLAAIAKLIEHLYNDNCLRQGHNGRLKTLLRVRIPPLAIGKLMVKMILRKSLQEREATG